MNNIHYITNDTLDLKIINEIIVQDKNSNYLKRLFQELRIAETT